MSAAASAPRSAFDADTLAQAGFPQISYETLALEETFRSDDRLIRPQDVEAYAFAVDDYDPWFFGPGPYGNPVAHPTILANQALMLRHNHYVVPAGLHARMRFEFVAPIRLGVRARTDGRIADKYIRRDKPYMVTAFKTAADDGTSLVQGRFVQMLFKSERAPAAGSAPRPAPEPAALDPGIRAADGRGGQIESGQPLPALQRSPSQRQIDVYSGVKPLSIHTDPEWARAKGLRTTIAQGMMSTAYVSSLMTAVVGEGFLVGGTMDARFLRPVFCDDELTITGTVDGFCRDGERVRVHVTVLAHNQLDKQTLAATSTALCG